MSARGNAAPPPAESDRGVKPLLQWTRIAGVALMLAGPSASLLAQGDPTAPGVRYEQRIGAALPLDAVVRDETDARRTLGDFFGHRPVVLIFGYARCPQLCSVVSNSAVESLRQLVETAGEAFDVVYVSIDPTDGANDLAAMKRRDVRRYGRSPPTAWHYVSGDVASLRRIAAAAGFHFEYDPRSRLYGHPSGFLIATPGGVVSRYFLGIDYAPKDIAAALRRAAAGKTGESVFDLLLLCARGDGVRGKYGRVIWIALDVGVIGTVGLLGWGIARMLRDERRRQHAQFPG